jgi:hypothetical protein
MEIRNNDSSTTEPQSSHNVPPDAPPSHSTVIPVGPQTIPVPPSVAEYLGSSTTAAPMRLDATQVYIARSNGTFRIHLGDVSLADLDD